MKSLLAIIAVALVLWASPCFAAGNNMEIRREDYGEEWPFTVPRGVLECIVLGRLSSGQVLTAVTFQAKGKVYAVNGTARGHAKKHGWHDVQKIWRNDPRIPGAKVNIGSVISRGLLLCGVPG